jgi:hypothetical protein
MLYLDRPGTTYYYTTILLYYYSTALLQPTQALLSYSGSVAAPVPPNRTVAKNLHQHTHPLWENTPRLGPIIISIATQTYRDPKRASTTNSAATQCQLYRGMIDLA